MVQVHMDAGGQPVVVVVDRAWQSFEQFTAALAREGVTVVYVGIGLRPHSRRVRAFVYDRVVFLPDLSGLAGVLADVVREHGDALADILSNELDLPQVVEAARSAAVPARVLEQIEGRVPFSDKVDAAERLRSWGLPTPRTCPPGTSAEQVVATLGLPVVVKGRRGAGGLAVTFAGSVAQVAEAAAEISGRTGQPAFYEEFIDGRNINYACVYANGEVAVDCCYDAVRVHGDDSRPPTAMQTLRDDAVHAIGAGMARRMPGVGVMNIETMSAPGGGYAVIDTNVRPFGEAATMRAGGIDLVGAYARSLGAVGRPGAFVPEPVLGTTLSVFPTASEGLLATGVRPAVVDYVRSLPDAIRDLGPRYGVLATLAFASRVACTTLTEVRTALAARTVRRS